MERLLLISSNVLILTVWVFSNFFSMTISNSILFSMFCTIFSFTSIFPLQFIMILMPSWHNLKCLLMQFEHIRTNFRNAKHKREHLLIHGTLWNAEDGLNPLYATTSAMLPARLECPRPKIKRVTGWLNWLLVSLKKFFSNYFNSTLCLWTIVQERISGSKFSI
jgi:hypothetical protein